MIFVSRIVINHGLRQELENFIIFYKIILLILELMLQQRIIRQTWPILAAISSPRSGNVDQLRHTRHSKGKGEEGTDSIYYIIMIYCIRII